MSTELTSERLAEWRKLADAATEGPWYASWADAERDESVKDYSPVFAQYEQQEAEFIVAAREAVPALLDEVERLRVELEGETAAADRMKALAEAVSDEQGRIADERDEALAKIEAARRIAEYSSTSYHLAERVIAALVPQTKEGDTDE